MFDISEDLDGEAIYVIDLLEWADNNFVEPLTGTPLDISEMTGEFINETTRGPCWMMLTPTDKAICVTGVTPDAATKVLSMYA